ncbi:MAG: M3 family metallopeptidase [Fluviibacter sp.]
MNPLLDFAGLPRFDVIQPTDVQPAISQLLEEARAEVTRLLNPDVPATWNDFAQPLQDNLERLSRAWGIVGHLHSVNDIPPWREAYNAMLPEVTTFYAGLGQNLALFKRYQALAASPEFATLTPARQRILKNEIRDFRLSGAELLDSDKPRFQALQERLSQLAAKFSENLLDATNAFHLDVTNDAELDGLPADVKAAAKTTAEKAGVSGWRFSLQAPSYLPVMQYASHRPLRAQLYRAYAVRASEFADCASKPEWNNDALINEILKLRAEMAQMLGYQSYAEVSLVPKMADNVPQVLVFLRDLAAKAKPYGAADLAELTTFAKTELGFNDIEPWDIAYISEKLKQARYSFSDDEVKQYFPEPKVLGGLFRVIERLFSMQITPDNAPVWHPSVRFFRISKDNQLIGQFYLDLYAREEKRGGAWMDEALTRRRIGKGIQTPVAYLNCNFPAPVGDKPATFSHDDVITLFHETGHGLHHMLTQVEDLAVSGIHGVEWDAVELPSQFMENFCWEWSVLQGMTAHVDTGAPLPRALYDKMLSAKNYQSGLFTLRQLEFALFDLLIHSDPACSRSVLDVLADVRKEVAVITPPAWHRFPNSFSHIFAGGYAAGYYSYKWAEVLSADAFAAFEESGDPVDPATGARFLKEILSVGGSRPAIEAFRAFRGRDPQVDALLRHSGMTAETA